MKKITKVYEGHTFDELDDTAKDCVRQWFAEGFDYDWYDCEFENFIEDMAGFGVGVSYKSIEFSGFYSQGDGLCFSTDLWSSDIVKYLKATKQTKKYWVLYLNLLRENITLRYGIKGNSRWGYGLALEDNDLDIYSDRISDNDDACSKIYLMVDKLGEDIIDFCRDKASDLYRSLENEYEYMLSDEAISESCEANEYYFTKKGRII